MSHNYMFPNTFLAFVHFGIYYSMQLKLNEGRIVTVFLVWAYATASVRTHRDKEKFSSYSFMDIYGLTFGKNVKADHLL